MEMKHIQRGFDKNINITLNILSQTTEVESLNDPDAYIILKKIIFHNVWLVKTEPADLKYDSTDLLFRNAQFVYDYFDEE